MKKKEKERNIVGLNYKYFWNWEKLFCDCIRKKQVWIGFEEKNFVIMVEKIELGFDDLKKILFWFQQKEPTLDLRIDENNFVIVSESKKKFNFALKNNWLLLGRNF